MKYILLLLLLFPLCTTTQAQVEARLHQVIHTISDEMKIAIDGENYEVNIKETYATVVVIETIVTLDKASPNQIEDIIKTGRYHVTHKEKDGVMTLTTKEDLVPIIIEGKAAEEYVIFNISVPEYMDWSFDTSNKVPDN